jgi:hypothetical protein
LTASSKLTVRPILRVDAAVDAVLTPLLRQGAGFAKTRQPADVPYLMFEEEHRSGAVEISEDGIACTKAICNYIYETYGRFPAGLDAMQRHMPMS